MRQYAIVQPRLTIEISHASKVPSFSADVLRGLSAQPKWLDPMYLYDAKGSELFDRICRLPEYYVTRTERGILEQCANEISAYSSGSMRLVELGSGNSEKTRLLIEALIRRQGDLRYIPIDISSSAVVQSAYGLIDDYPQISVEAHIADYRAGLSHLADVNQTQKLIVFMGSNLGNFDPVHGLDLLCWIQRCMSKDDYFLIGNDLAKPESVLLPAYDDEGGITAAFNLNILHRINRELGGGFDASMFNHLAVYNTSRCRIEMHLQCARPHRVPVRNLETSFGFERGETIHTENSYKYTTDQLDDLFQAAGLVLVKRWFDPRKWFSVSLLALDRTAASGPKRRL